MESSGCWQVCRSGTWAPQVLPSTGGFGTRLQALKQITGGLLFYGFGPLESLQSKIPLIQMDSTIAQSFITRYKGYIMLPGYLSGLLRVFFHPFVVLHPPIK